MKNLNLSPELKALIGSIITGLTIAALVLYGIAQQLAVLTAESQAEGRGGSITRFNSEVQMLNGAEVTNGLTTDSLTNSGDTSLTGALTAGSATVTTATITSLSLEGVTFTGPVVGVTGSISNNVRLAHGLNTTPTVALCGVVNAGNITQTVYLSATNATSITLGVFDSAGAVWTGALTVHCIGQR